MTCPAAFARWVETRAARDFDALYHAIRELVDANARQYLRGIGLRLSADRFERLVVDATARLAMRFHNDPDYKVGHWSAWALSAIRFNLHHPHSLEADRRWTDATEAVGRDHVAVPLPAPDDRADLLVQLLDLPNGRDVVYRLYRAKRFRAFCEWARHALPRRVLYDNVDDLFYAWQVLRRAWDATEDAEA